MNPDPDPIESTYEDPLPQLRDVVTIDYGLEPYEQRPGVVIDIYPQPHIETGDRYRVEYRDGTTAWYWADEITVDGSPFDQQDVIAALTAARTSLFQAIRDTERHDVLHDKLSAVFDSLTAIARTYLDTDLTPVIDRPEADTSTEVAS